MSQSDYKPVADFVVCCWQAYPVGSERETLSDAGIGPVPKSLQRRLSPLARIVFQTLAACIRYGEQIPAVFSSAHGEVGRSLAMLQSMQQGEELSPTAFSLSVHNAIAGLFSMAYANRQETSVIAPGKDGIASGFIEALGLLQEGHEAVLLVFYDEPVPPFFPVAPFQLNPRSPHALALKLSTSDAGLPLRFLRHDGQAAEREQPLQIAEFIAFLDSAQTQVQLGGWSWQKH